MEGIVAVCLDSLGAFASQVMTQPRGDREARHGLANALQACELLDVKVRANWGSGPQLERLAKLERHLHALVDAALDEDLPIEPHHQEVVMLLGELRDLFAGDDGNGA